MTTTFTGLDLRGGPWLPPAERRYTDWSDHGL